MKQTLTDRYRKDLSYDHDAQRLGIPLVCLALLMRAIASNEMRELGFFSLAVLADMQLVGAISAC